MVRNEHAVVLELPELWHVDDAGEVRVLAIERVVSLNGIARMVVGTFRPVAVGTISGEHADGHKSIFVTAELGIRAGFEVATSPPQPPDPRPAAWMARAARYPEVLQALRYFGEPPTPVSLWKVYEVVRADAGGTVSPDHAALRVGARNSETFVPGYGDTRRRNVATRRSSSARVAHR